MLRVSRFVAIAAAVLVVGGIHLSADGSAVRFSLDQSGGIIVQARINGQGPFRLLVDTGSNRSVIGQKVADELCAPVVAKTAVVSVGSEITRLVVRLDRVEAGSAAQSGLLASVAPGAELRAVAPGVDGLLGQDFLASFDYTIDYRKRVLTWTANPAMFRPTDSRLVLRAKEGRFIADIPQDDRGRTTLRLVPDSGAAMIVLFKRDGQPPVRLDQRSRTAELSGLSGSRRAEIWSAPALRIGTTVLRDCPVVMAPGAPDTTTDGLLPLRLFDRVAFRASDRLLFLAKD